MSQDEDDPDDGIVHTGDDSVVDAMGIIYRQRKQSAVNLRRRIASANSDRTGHQNAVALLTKEIKRLEALLVVREKEVDAAKKAVELAESGRWETL